MKSYPFHSQRPGKSAPFRLALGVVVLGGMGLGPVAAQQNRSGDSCAIYGSGFVAVQGSGSCVQIGGRVRLDLNGAAQVHSFAPMGGHPTPGLFQNPSGPVEGINRARMNLGNRR